MTKEIIGFINKNNDIFNLKEDSSASKYCCKVGQGHENKIAVFTEDGNLKDSGSGIDESIEQGNMDLATCNAVYIALQEKTDKVKDAVEGNLVSLDENGNLQDSGITSALFDIRLTFVRDENGEYVIDEDLKDTLSELLRLVPVRTCVPCSVTAKWWNVNTQNYDAAEYPGALCIVKFGPNPRLTTSNIYLSFAGNCFYISKLAVNPFPSRWIKLENPFVIDSVFNTVPVKSTDSAPTYDDKSLITSGAVHNALESKAPLTHTHNLIVNSEAGVGESRIMCKADSEGGLSIKLHIEEDGQEGVIAEINSNNINNLNNALADPDNIPKTGSNKLITSDAVKSAILGVDNVDHKILVENSSITINTTDNSVSGLNDFEDRFINQRFPYFVKLGLYNGVNTSYIDNAILKYHKEGTAYKVSIYTAANVIDITGTVTIVDDEEIITWGTATFTNQADVDTVPTDGSDKLITSGGVDDALQGKANNTHYHTELTSNPSNSANGLATINVQEGASEQDLTIHEGAWNVVIKRGNSAKLLNVNYGNIDNLINLVSGSEDPTQGSNKYSTSSQIYTALEKKMDKIPTLRIDVDSSTSPAVYPIATQAITLLNEFIELEQDTQIPVIVKLYNYPNTYLGTILGVAEWSLTSQEDQITVDVYIGRQLFETFKRNEGQGWGSFIDWTRTLNQEIGTYFS